MAKFVIRVLTMSLALNLVVFLGQLSAGGPGSMGPSPAPSHTPSPAPSYKPPPPKPSAPPPVVPGKPGPPQIDLMGEVISATMEEECQLQPPKGGGLKQGTPEGGSRG